MKNKFKSPGIKLHETEKYEPTLGT